MDTYFCYIHRTARTVPEMKVLSGHNQDQIGHQLAQLMTDYPSASVEIFQGDRLIVRIETDGPGARASQLSDALEAMTRTGGLTGFRAGAR